MVTHSQKQNCVIHAFQDGHCCAGECKDYSAINAAMNKRHAEQRRRDAAGDVKIVVCVSLAFLVGLAVVLSFVHADEKFRRQEIAEAV